jgi:serine/threonine-protein kinase
MSDESDYRTSPFVTPTFDLAGREGPDTSPEALPDRYASEGMVAQGGMGAILRVYDKKLGRALALKVLHAQFRDQSDMVQRFLDEAHIAGQLQHPGIAPIHDLGHLADGRPYFAMKLVKGETLAELLARRTSSAENLAHWLQVFEQIAQTIAYAHSRGVIHRDLKPANVMVGAFGEVQVMDWGLAKLLPGAGSGDFRATQDAPETSTFFVPVQAGDEATQAGTVLGTPAYMAPEQARGEISRVDERSDVFGLGAILCSILTGKPPYSGATTGEVMRQARQGDLSNAIARLDNCGADMEVISLGKACLAVNPEGRPRHAGEVALAITAYRAAVEERLRAAERDRAAAEARAEKARVVAAAERRLRRRTWGLALVLVLLVSMGAGGALWWVRQRDHEVRAAEAALRESQLLRDQGNWPAARAAAERAEALLPVTGAPTELRARITTAQIDIETAGTLDAIRLSRADQMDKDHFGLGREQVRYEEAFLQYGLDTREGDLDELAERVRSSAIRDQLVVALDEWARGRIESDATGAARLLSIAVRADPDPWRNAVRHPETWLNREKLKELARRPEALDQPPSLLALLADTLGRVAQSPQSAVELLLAAQRKHPGDFWLNHELAYYLGSLEPPRTVEAVGYYRAALAIRPDSPGVHHNLGRALLVLDRLDEAEAAFRRAIELQDNYSFAHNNLGVVLQKSGRDNEAEAEFRKAVAINPNNTRALYNLGGQLQEKGDRSGAIDCYRKIVALNPSHGAHTDLGINLYRLGQLREAVTVLRESARLRPRDGHVRSNLGLALSDLGDQKAALPILDEALQLLPNDPVIYKNRGLAYSRMGKQDEAIRDYRESIRLRPRDAQVYANLGAAYLRKGELRMARAACAEAVGIEPTNADAQYNLGVVLTSLRQYERAELAFREVVKLRPDRAPGFQHLVLTLANQGKWSEVIDVGRKAIVLNPDHALTHMNLGQAFMEMNDLEQGEPHLRKAVQLSPRSSMAHANLAVIRIRQQRWAEAERHLCEAVRLDPEAANARCDLGSVLLRRGASRQAVVQLRKATELNPQFIDAYLDMGRALIAQGDFAKAIKALEHGRHMLGEGDERLERFNSAIKQARKLRDAERKLPAILGFALIREPATLAVALTRSDRQLAFPRFRSLS